MITDAPGAFEYLTFDVAVRCDRGRVREENQDRAAARNTPLGTLLMVADGVGGLQSGGLAAQLAVDGYEAFLRTADPQIGPALLLRQATQSVNEAIRHEAQRTQKSMASTVALALVSASSACIGHVGDSRVYRIRQGILSRLTRDHSIVQKMVDHGILTEAQALVHPDASVLTSSLGQAEAVLEISQIEWLAGDALLLCSDGLWGYVSEEALQQAAADTAASADTTVDRFLQLALEAGGGDNIGIVIVKNVVEPTGTPE